TRAFNAITMKSSSAAKTARGSWSGRNTFLRNRQRETSSPLAVEVCLETDLLTRQQRAEQNRRCGASGHGGADQHPEAYPSRQPLPAHAQSQRRIFQRAQGKLARLALVQTGHRFLAGRSDRLRPQR